MKAELLFVLCDAAALLEAVLSRHAAIGTEVTQYSDRSRTNASSGQVLHMTDVLQS